MGSGGYNRPEGGWRYNFEGIKTNSSPDAMDPVKFPYAQNIRGYSGQSMRTRWGYTQLFSASAPVTDIRSYTTLGTDNAPRYLARNANNQIYLDNSLLIGTLDGSSQNCCMVPYRPNMSPQSWMYIGNEGDYRKASAPDSGNNVLFYKAGIAENQVSPEVCPQSLSLYGFSSNAAGWTQGGVAGAPSDSTRIATDHIVSLFADPASGVDTRYSLEVSTTVQYQIGMGLNVGGTYDTIVQDILPPLNNGTDVSIAGIFYFSGSSGRCIIVPTQMPATAAVPSFNGSVPSATSVYSDMGLASLRRGSIVKLKHGGTTEKVFVNSVSTGPSGLISFEAETTNTFQAGDTVTGAPAVIVTGINGATVGMSINAVDILSTFSGAGVGTLSQALGTNPFIQPLNPSNYTPQQDDYVIFGVNISDLSKLVQGVIKFNIDATVNYSLNYYYATFVASDLIFHPPISTFTTTVVATPNDSASSPLDDTNTSTTEEYTSLTPLPSSQWTTVIVPIRSLFRAGNDLTRTLSNCNGVQVSLQVTGGINVAIAGFYIAGGGSPNVGNNLSPYFYLVRGRNSDSGAVSNPSPITRYGVGPRRQSVNITVRDTSGDLQNNTWDVYRFGGTINSWRRIGSMPNSQGSLDIFIDNFFDTEANAGSPAEFDNFEPWPTLDVPFNLTSGTVGPITTTIRVIGTSITVVWSSPAPFSNPAPDTILRWLPGTLVLLGGQTAFTLRNRPTAITLVSPPSANYFAYLFEVVENAGVAAPPTLSVLEPNVANQKLPYLWGSDAYGTIFAAGDPFRPGSFYSCKSFNPDSAPDTHNQELTQPGEPILGGEVLNGLSFAASSQRWWSLYRNFGGGGNQYQAVERPVGRGLASPYGHCTDGKYIYFVAKDGIWMTSGGPGVSLTDGDLFNMFPHEGINLPENYTYGAYTIYAPDYSYAARFRLRVVNSYLYFDYLDSTGTNRTLVCDMTDATKPKWVIDKYADPISVHWGVEQPESSLSSSGRRQLMVLGDSNGVIWQAQDLVNDGAVPIEGVSATFEYTAGDLRAEQLFNDVFMDVVPVSDITAQAMSDSAAVGAPTIVPASNNRVRTNIPVGFEVKYLGLLLQWIDDFTSVSNPTTLNAWQPMYQAIPVSVTQWKTQVTAFGWRTWGHLKQWNLCYRALADVTMTITSHDGTSPTMLTLPSTGGAVAKVTFSLTANKGLLYDFLGVSSRPWAPYLSESELLVGEWGREDQYKEVHDINAPTGFRS